jgi:manganese efflux pump family protein
MLVEAIKVAVVAISLSIDTFAVGVGVGIRGVPRGLKLRIGAAFAFAEVAMNCIGAGLGAAVGQLLGDAAGYLGFVALVAVGLYTIREGVREAAERRVPDFSTGWGLAFAAMSISLDSLGVGFSIAYIGVPMPVSLSAIAITSVAATTIGLGVGRRLGRHVEDRAELLAGVILTLTGAVFIALKALRLD